MCPKIAMNSAQHICDNIVLQCQKDGRPAQQLKVQVGKGWNYHCGERQLIEWHSNRARRAVYHVFSELDTKNLMHLNIIFYRKLWKLLTVKQEEDGTLCFK